MTDNDSQVGDLLNRAVATLEPRTRALVAAGTARGRTLRRRRRITQAASGVALAGLIGGIAVAVWPSGGAGAPRRIRTRPPRRPRSCTDAPPTGTITPQVIAQRTIDALLSAGTVRNLSGNYDQDQAGTELVYNDGRGAALIDVSLDFVGAGQSAVCQIAVCTTRPDGSKLAVYRGSDRPGQPNAEPQEWSVSLLRRDGVAVTLTEWNAPGEKGSAATTRVDPPLSRRAGRAVRPRRPVAGAGAAAGDRRRRRSVHDRRISTSRPVARDPWPGEAEEMP